MSTHVLQHVPFEGPGGITRLQFHLEMTPAGAEALMRDVLACLVSEME